MRRPLLLMSAVLAALTALILAAAAIAIRPPGFPGEADGPGEAANRALVFAFYDGINAAVATGDLTALTPLATPDLLGCENVACVAPDPAGLARRLRVLHASAPTFRLAIDALAVDGDLAIARIRATEDLLPWLGLSLTDHPAIWDPVDVLHLAGGAVTAIGGGRPNAGLLEPTLTVDFPVVWNAQRALAIRRLTLAPGAEHHSIPVDSPRLLLLESGSVTADAAADVATGFPGLDGAMLTTGEYRVVPPNTRLAVRNAGPAPAVLVDVFALSLDYRAPASPEGVTTALGESVEVQVLVGGIATQMPKGPVVLAIGRATLAPGGRLAWDGAAGPAVIIVEAGTPAVHTTGGLAQARVTADGPLLSRTEDALVPGGNVLLEAGTSARVDAGPAGPATVLVFTLLPGTEPPPADAGPRTKSS